MIEFFVHSRSPALLAAGNPPPICPTAPEVGRAEHYMYIFFFTGLSGPPCRCAGRNISYPIGAVGQWGGHRPMDLLLGSRQRKGKGKAEETMERKEKENKGKRSVTNLNGKHAN